AARHLDHETERPSEPTARAGPRRARRIRCWPRRLPRPDPSPSALQAVLDRGAALAPWCRRPRPGPPSLPPPTAPPARVSPGRHAALATAPAGYESGPVEIVRAWAASTSRLQIGRASCRERG